MYLWKKDENKKRSELKEKKEGKNEERREERWEEERKRRERWKEEWGRRRKENVKGSKADPLEGIKILWIIRK